MNAIPLPRRQNKVAGLAIKLGAALTVTAVVLGYTLYHVKDAWRGPGLKIESPANGLTLNQNLIEIKGTTVRTAKLDVNGQSILANESGRFAEKLLLAPGYNTIKITVSDRFGRRQNHRLELTYQAPVLNDD